MVNEKIQKLLRVLIGQRKDKIKVLFADGEAITADPGQAIDIMGNSRKVVRFEELEVGQGPVVGLLNALLPEDDEIDLEGVGAQD